MALILVGRTDPLVAVGLAYAGISIITFWVLWFFRHTAMCNVKYVRLYWIEKILGMYQHRMIGYALQRKWLGVVPGWVLALLLWLLVCVVWILLALLAVTAHHF